MRVILGFIVIFCIYSNLYSQTLYDRYMKLSEIHSEEAWDEYSNNYHFNKSLEYLNLAIEELQKNKKNSDLNQLYINKKLLIKRIETFQNLKSNLFPLGPFLSKSYPNHNRFLEPYYIATNTMLDGIIPVIENYSKLRGQVVIMPISEGIFDMNGNQSFSDEIFETIFRKLTDQGPYRPLSREEIIMIYGQVPKYNEIVQNINRLKDFSNKESLDHLFILKVSGFTRDEYNAYVEGELLSFEKDSNNLYSFVKLDASGKNTNVQFEQSRERILVYSIIYIIIIIFVLIIDKIQKEFRLYKLLKYRNDNSKFKNTNLIGSILKKDLFDKNLFFSLFFILIINLIGSFYSWSIGIIADDLIGDWTSKIESTWKMYSILIALNIIIIPFVLVFIHKIYDFSTLMKDNILLPIFIASFYAGIGFNLYFNQYYYNLLYPSSDLSTNPISIIGNLALIGFIHGILIKRWIEILSIRFKNYDHKSSINVQLLILTILNIIPNLFLSFYFYITLRNLKYPLFLYFSAFCYFIISITFLYYFFKLNFEDISSSIESKETIHPNDLLKKDNSEFPFISPIILTNLSFFKKPELFNPDQILPFLINAQASEVGTIAIIGPKYSGKNRLAKEIEKISSTDCPNQKTFYIDCSIRNSNIPLEPFIIGFRSIPEINAILESSHISLNTEKFISTFSELIASIPIIGRYVEKYLSSNYKIHQSFSDSDMGNFILEKISILSRKLIKNSKYYNKSRDSIIITIDSAEQLKIVEIEFLKNLVNYFRSIDKSPEQNNICIIFLFNESNSNPKTLKVTDEPLLKPKLEIKVLGIGDIDHSENTISLKSYIFEKLNFLRIDSNISMVDSMFETYKESILLSNTKYYFINPFYIIETIKYLYFKNRLLTKENIVNGKIEYKFVYLKSDLSLDIPPKLKQELRIQFSMIREESINLLKIASILGDYFTIEELSHLLEISEKTVIECISDIEKSTSILEKYPNGNGYSFMNQSYKILLLEELHYPLDNNHFSKKLEILNYYYEKSYDLVSSYNQNDQLHKKRLAEISYHCGEKYLETKYNNSLELVKYFYESNQKKESIHYLNLASKGFIDSIQIESQKSLEEYFTGREKFSKTKIPFDYLFYYSLLINDFKNLIFQDHHNLQSFREIINKIFYNINFSNLKLDKNSEYFPFLILSYLNDMFTLNLLSQDLNTISKLLILLESYELELDEDDPIYLWNKFVLFLLHKLYFKVSSENQKFQNKKDSNLINSIDSMESIYKKNMDKLSSLNHRTYSFFLNSLAEVYKNLNPNLAIDYYEETIRIKKKESDYTGIAMAQSGLIDLYHSKNEMDKSRKLIESNYEINLNASNYYGITLVLQQIRDLQMKDLNLGLSENLSIYESTFFNKRKHSDFYLLDEYHIIGHLEKVSDEYKINNESKLELINKELSKSGSKFYSSFDDSSISEIFNNPTILFDFLREEFMMNYTFNIDREIDYLTIDISKTKFSNSFPNGVGKDSLVEIHEELKKHLIKGERSFGEKNCEVNLLENYIPPYTSLITIVGKLDRDPSSPNYGKLGILTIYPGKYAPPYPNEKMDIEEWQKSKLFWDNHAFSTLNQL